MGDAADRIRALNAFTNAMRTPDRTFADHRLRMMTAAPGADANEPLVTVGRFTAAYRLLDPFWTSPPLVVRCYLMRPTDLVVRYQAIAAYLRGRTVPGIVPTELIDKGVEVVDGNGGRHWEPVVIHPWVGGTRFDVVVREAIVGGQAATVLPDLRARICALAERLAAVGIAHGDIAPASIIVDEDGELTLVDYDGMVVPSLVGRVAVEERTPDWRHPRRGARTDLALDRFPFITIWMSLLVLEHAPELLAPSGAQDGRLVFAAADLAAPARSDTFDHAGRVPALTPWIAAYAGLCSGPEGAVPTLTDFAAVIPAQQPPPVMPPPVVQQPPAPWPAADQPMQPAPRGAPQPMAPAPWEPQPAAPAEPDPVVEPEPEPEPEPAVEPEPEPAVESGPEPATERRVEEEPEAVGVRVRA
ncbi:MAG: hypothetical protein ACKOTZ_11840, partial [Chloroflexota bacterium]